MYSSYVFVVGFIFGMKNEGDFNFVKWGICVDKEDVLMFSMFSNKSYIIINVLGGDDDLCETCL